MMKNIRNIKAKVYTISEVTKLCDVHKRTLSEWRRNGLKTINDKRPFLIHGNDLKAFLKARNQERKTKISEGQIYCVKCKEGVFPINVVIEERNQKQIIVKGTCPSCGRKINRFGSINDVQKWVVPPAKVQPLETHSPKKIKKKKETEQMGLLDLLDSHINSHLGDAK